MTITPQQLISLLPLLILGITVLVVMLCIAWKRNHLISATLTITGLIFSLISILFISTNDVVNITPLLCVDNYSLFYTSIIILASLATCTFAYLWLLSFPKNKDEFYLLILISAIGGIVLTNSIHLTSLFVGIELLSLPLFGLIGYSFHQKYSLEASLKYTILSATASSFLLFGIGLIYADSGSMTFINLIKFINNTIISPLTLLGIGMIIISMCFKLSLVPFHLWTPDVYQGAPAPVSTFLATVSKIAIFVVMVRFLTYTKIINIEIIRVVLSIIAFISILFGNLMAISQNNIKRLLGYSSIAHLGYLLILLISIQKNQFALESIGVYLTGYVLSNLGAFGVISLISSPYQGQDADSLYLYRGLFWHRPILSSVLTITMLSLAGIPMTLGFIGKFYIISSSINAHLWWLTAAIVVGSGIGLYYYLRVIVSLYLKPPEIYVVSDTSMHWEFTIGGIVILIFATLLLLLGIYPQPLIKLVQMTNLII